MKKFVIKIIVCLIITFTICYFAGIAGVISGFSKNGFDWQIILYLIFSIFVLIGTWLIAFMKSKKVTKLIYAIVFFIWLFSPKILPSVMRSFDIDTCVDTGDCPKSFKSDYCIEDGDCEEGRAIHTKKYGSIKINKANCLKYNWEWYEKQKYCKVTY